MNHGSLQAPLGYYCQGDDNSTARPVPGRVGDINRTGAAPTTTRSAAPPAAPAAGSARPHYTNGVIDGYSSCTDAVGDRFNNPITVWRDPNATFAMDTSYIYSLRTLTGSMGLAVNVTGGELRQRQQNSVLALRAPQQAPDQDSTGNGTYKISFWENPGMCVENPANQTANGTRPSSRAVAKTTSGNNGTSASDQPTGCDVLQEPGSGNCLDDRGNTNAGNTAIRCGTATRAT